MTRAARELRACGQLTVVNASDAHARMMTVDGPGYASPMTHRLLALFALAALALWPRGTQATDVDERAVGLLQQHKCYVCHSDDEPFAGPAFADVAAGYRGLPNANATVERFILRGARGNAPWHMPPHPELTQAEAKAMARYILSLDKGEPKSDEAPSGTSAALRDRPATTGSPRS